MFWSFPERDLVLICKVISFLSSVFLLLAKKLKENELFFLFLDLFLLIKPMPVLLVSCFLQVLLLFCIYGQLYAFVSLFSFFLIYEYIVAIIVVDHKFLHLVHGPYIVFLSGDFIRLFLFMGNSNYMLETVLLSFSFPRTLIVAYIAETWLMIPPWVVAFMCCTLLVQMMLN